MMSLIPVEILNHIVTRSALSPKDYHSAISLSHLSQPTRQTRRADHTSFIPISARTDVYKYSFFPRTLLDWNTLPAEIRLKYSLSVSESADLVD